MFNQYIKPLIADKANGLITYVYLNYLRKMSGTKNNYVGLGLPTFSYILTGK